uniref:Macroglobulin domain-containing protein n=1 Tax=Capra hircus TaxID=9925 RepID=A0A452DQY8_CAPHI
MWGAQLGPLLRLLLLLLSPRDGVRAEQPQAPGYLIAAPSVFRSGVEEAISVTIFNSPREVMVQAQLVALGKAVAQSQGAIQGSSMLCLQVPTGLRGQALLKVWGRDWRVEEGSLFHNQTSVTVDSRGASVFIQTDKPVYRPKHRVLISIFTVTPDLRPTSEKLIACVILQDPRGSRMMEWRHLEPLCCGITNMTFPLSDQPVLGEWFIFVEMQGHVYNRSFEVQKYGKFQTWGIHSPKDLRAFETDPSPLSSGHLLVKLNYSLSFCSRYTFGKPVSGTLTVNMTVNGVGYYSQEVGRPILRTTKIHGSQDFSICVKDMIPADVPEHFRGTISIWAMVTAADGSHQVAFDDSTPVQRQLVDIRYSKDTRKQFKPGLSYVGKVELSYPDGSPAEGVTVQIRAELTPKDNIYTVESVSQGGLVEFEIPSIPMSAQHVWLEVFRELEDYDVSDIFGVSREDGPFWWTGLTARRRRRSSVFLWPWGITKDSGFAFAVRRGNGPGGDDRPGEPKPPAGWRLVH